MRTMSAENQKQNLLWKRTIVLLKIVAVIKQLYSLRSEKEQICEFH
jgi:hypothetical protein